MDHPPGPGPALHDALLDWAFLIGTWRGSGVVGYPTMTDRPFDQEVVFDHTGKSFLTYSSRTWDPATGAALAAETGYWRPQPGGEVEVLLVHPTGIAEIWTGRRDGIQVALATDVVVRTASAKEVTSGTRLYGIVEGALLYAADLAMMGHPRTPHFSARLERLPGTGMLVLDAP